MENPQDAYVNALAAKFRVPETRDVDELTPVETAPKPRASNGTAGVVTGSAANDEAAIVAAVQREIAKQSRR